MPSSHCCRCMVGCDSCEGSHDAISRREIQTMRGNGGRENCVRYDPITRQWSSSLYPLILASTQGFGCSNGTRPSSFRPALRCVGLPGVRVVSHQCRVVTGQRSRRVRRSAAVSRVSRRRVVVVVVVVVGRSSCSHSHSPVNKQAQSSNATPFPVSRPSATCKMPNPLYMYKVSTIPKAPNQCSRSKVSVRVIYKRCKCELQIRRR